MKIAQHLLLLVSISGISYTLAMENAALSQKKQEEIENYRQRIKIGKGEKLGSTGSYKLSAFFTGKNSIFGALSANNQDDVHIAEILEQLTVYSTNIIKGREVRYSYAFDVEPLKKILQEQNTLLIEQQTKQMEQIAQLQAQVEEAKQAKENLQQLNAQEIKSLQTKLQSHQEQQIKTQPSLLQSKLFVFGLGAVVAGIILKASAIIKTM